jgi:hypothetical protein
MPNLIGFSMNIRLLKLTFKRNLNLFQREKNLEVGNLFNEEQEKSIRIY